MADEPDKIPQTRKEKLLFYTTAFFLLLGIFSLFGFLFLVPFIIEPAYTTIKMDFDEEPAQCFTASIKNKRGLSNCSWTSCKEGCTKEVYECTQIQVNYKHRNIPDNTIVSELVKTDNDGYKWIDGGKLFPNVKGCGYPPFLNCTTFNNTYAILNASFPCYFSRFDPMLLVTQLNMSQVRVNLICALVLPIVSFILSVVYLTIAYLYIYNDENAQKNTTPCRKVSKLNNHHSKEIIHQATTSTPLAPPTSGVLSPTSDIFREDMASFGHQLKYAMVDDNLLSTESGLDSLAFNYANSINGNLNKMMTTCILTPPGPIAQL